MSAGQGDRSLKGDGSVYPSRPTEEGIEEDWEGVTCEVAVSEF